LSRRSLGPILGVRGFELAMKTLTKESAMEILGGRPLEAFLRDQQNRLRRARRMYSIPRDSGRKTALSRTLCYVMPRESVSVLYISGWGVWPSSENLDLFHGYRRSLGEPRSLSEASVHVFDPTDSEALTSILSMVFYFVWDAWLFDADARVLLGVSHDEWLELLAADPRLKEGFEAELEAFGMPALDR
jgi:hypothetical protein